MYKVCYYIGGGNRVVFKLFKTLTEATEFSNSQPLNSILEIKLYTDEHKKENRT